MALDPLVPVDDRIVEVSAGNMSQPSKTYYLDFESGRIRRPIDGRRAIQQFIRMSLKTERFRYLIYDENFGSELHALIAEDLPQELLETEIPRVIREALLIDDRIQDVKNFEITRDKDIYYVTFEVETVEGTFTEGLEANT